MLRVRKRKTLTTAMAIALLVDVKRSSNTFMISYTYDNSKGERKCEYVPLVRFLDCNGSQLQGLDTDATQRIPDKK